MHTRFALAAALSAALLVTGCSVTKIDTDHMTALELIDAPQYMGIYPVVPKDVKVVGPVAAELCQKKLTDRAPTGEEALTALKVEAAKLGGTALAEVSFGTDAAQTAYCYSTAHAKGIAYVRN